MMEITSEVVEGLDRDILLVTCKAGDGRQRQFRLSANWNPTGFQVERDNVAPDAYWLTYVVNDERVGWRFKF